MEFVNQETEPKTFLSTGSLILDLSLSHKKNKYGGIPTRRIVEFHGTAGSGKTFLNLEICASAKRQGFEIRVDDIERRWDLDRLSSFGLVEEDLGYKTSNTTEECFDGIFEFIQKSKSDRQLIIVDPIAALITEQDAAGEEDKMGMKRAKLLQKYFRRLKEHIGNHSKKEVSIILANQIIDNPNATMFQKKTKTPCGRAIEHWPSIRVELGVLQKLKETSHSQSKVVGTIVGSEIIKNSDGDPFVKGKTVIKYGYGIDNIESCILWLSEHTDSLKKGKSIYCLGDLEFSSKEKSEFIFEIEKSGSEQQLFELTVSEFNTYYKRQKRKKKVCWLN